MNMADEQATTAAVKAAQHDNETGISITEFTDEQIKELCEAATPGPWEVKDSAWITGHFMEHIGIADMGGEGWIGIVSVRPRAEEAADIEDDATFIAAARELVPRLLERTQKAEHLADVYRSELGQCMDNVRRQHEHLGLVTRELNDLRELWRWISVDERLPDDGDMVIARHTSQDVYGRFLGGWAVV